MYGNVTIAGGGLTNLGIVTQRISVFGVSSKGLPQFRGLRQSEDSNPAIALGFILILSL